MKVESMDASNASVMRVTGSNGGTDSTKENKNPKSVPAKDAKEARIPERVVSDALDKANKVIASNNRRFEYSIHKKTHEIMIKVINTDTNEVVREIPPEKILDLIANLMQLAGLVVDERR